jgi:macrodomain Ter protein organizer (MatP/YcbG family)
MIEQVKSKRIRGKRATGTVEKHSKHPKISVKFEREIFEKIADYSQKNRVAFGEAVRLLIDYAFDKLDQEDAEDHLSSPLPPKEQQT